VRESDAYAPSNDLDAAAFAAIVRDASDEALDELMTAPEREEVLEAVFARMPARIRCDSVGQLEAVVHWHVAGRADGGYDAYEVTIRDGACRVAKPPVRPPDAILRIDGTAFLRLVARATDATRLMRTGDLTVTGDVGLARRVETLFDRP
jgi:hypothetical protein